MTFTTFTFNMWVYWKTHWQTHTLKVTQWCEDRPSLRSVHMNLLLLGPVGELQGLYSCFLCLKVLPPHALAAADAAQLHQLAGQLLVLEEQWNRSSELRRGRSREGVVTTEWTIWVSLSNSTWLLGHQPKIQNSGVMWWNTWIMKSIILSFMLLIALCLTPFSTQLL